MKQLSKYGELLMKKYEKVLMEMGEKERERKSRGSYN